MKERTSKQLLFVEAVIFLVPVSLLTGLYALFLIPMYVSGALLREPLEAHTVPMLGAVVVAASGLAVILLLAGFERPLLGLLSANYLAVPALVPFLHVMIERWHGRVDS